MKKIIFCFIFLATLLVSCQPDELTTSEAHIASESDLFCDYDMDPSDQKDHSTGANTRQNTSFTLPLVSNLEDIPVFIAISRDQTKDAIIDALELWENVSNCKLSFDFVSSPTTTGINFLNTSDKMNDGAIATLFPTIPSCMLSTFSWRGQFPQGDGFTGHYIVQSGFAYTQDENELIRVIAHELGHTLGFIHTNWPLGATWPITPCSPPIGAVRSVLCTPSSDPKSIMNSSVTDDTPKLSHYDKNAVRMMYPDDVYNPIITGHSVGYQTQSSRLVTLEFNSVPQYAYQVEIRRYYPSGNLAQTYISSCNSNGSYSLTTTPWPGQWKFKVTYKNVAGDVEATTPFYTVDMSL